MCRARTTPDSGSWVSRGGRADARCGRKRSRVAWGLLVLLALGAAGCAWLNPPPEEGPRMRRPSDWLKQPRPESQYQVQ